MNISIRHVALATAAMCATLPGIALAQAASETADQIPASFRLSTGATYSSGSYGETEDTEVFAIPLSLTYSDNGFKFRLSVPYIMIDGPGSLLSTPEGRDNFSGDDRIGSISDNSGSGSSNSGSGSSGSGSSGSGTSGSNSGSSGSGTSGSGSSGSGSSGSGSSGSGSSGSSGSGSSGSEVEVEDNTDGEVVANDGVVDSGGFAATDNRRAGFGDINLFASYSFDLGGGTYLDPSVKLKLPIASKADRLGTGEVDVTTAIDLVHEFGPATVYIHGRRKFAGKPTGSSVRSTWGAGGGVSLRAADGVSFGADYDWQQSAFVLRPASNEVSAWASFRLGQGISMTTYAGTGLNASSADLFGGVTVGFRF